MFTLGDKIRVLNADSHVKVFQTDGTTEVTDPLVIDDLTTGFLRIEGFQTFDLTRIRRMRCRRASLPVLNSKVFTIPTISGLAVGDSVLVHIDFETTRYESELMVQQGIGKGRGLDFQTFTLTGVTGANIATAITAAYTAYVAARHDFTPFLTIANTSDALTVSATAAYPSVRIKGIVLRRVANGQIILPQAVRPVVASETPGHEGHGLGKFLEESVRMSNNLNVDPYGVDSSDTQVDIRGKYTEINIDYLSFNGVNLGVHAVDQGELFTGGGSQGGTPAMHSFTIFLNESTCLGASNAIAKVAATTIAVNDLVGDATIMDIAAITGINSAEESVQALIVGANSVATAANFVA
jgi:hypothetical protein